MMRWPRRGGILLAWGCIVCACWAWAGEANRVGGARIPFEALAPRDTTIEWAAPLAGGPINVLFVAPTGAMRDAAELEARIAAKIESVALPRREVETAASANVVEAQDPGAPAPAEAPVPDNAWIDALRGALGHKHDVIVVGNVSFSRLPDDIQTLFAARVREGAGLVLSNVLLEGGPLDTFLAELAPADAGKRLAAGAAEVPVQGGKALGAFLHTLETERARVALLDVPGDPPLTHALLPPPLEGQYLQEAWREDAWSLVLRAVCWAAHRDPVVAINGMSDASPQGPSEDEIPPGLPQEFVQSMRDSAFNLPLHPISVQLAAPTPHMMEAVLQVRRRGEATIAYSTTAEIPKGRTLFSTQVLMNPGEFQVDCLLHGRKGVEDWWTLPVSVPGWPEASGLRADKTYLLPNDTLSLTATVRPIFGASRAGTVYARALDPAGNLLSDSAVGVDSNGGSVQIGLAFADVIAPIVIVEVYAFEGAPRRYAKVELASSGAQVLRFPVRQLRRVPRFGLVVDASERDEFNARWYLAQWRAHGADTLYTSGGGTAVVRAAELGLNLLPAVGHYAPVLRENETKPCLSDSDFLAGERKRVPDELAQYWAGGGGGASLGWPAFAAPAEGDKNPCQADACMRGFHAWLQKHYGSETALNAAWGGSWAAFDEVTPPDLAACRAAGRPAPWLNWRAFNDEAFAAALGSARNATLALDRAGATGFAALSDDDTRRGYDWALLAQNADFIAARVDFQVPEKLRAYLPRQRWGGIHASTLKSEAEGRWTAWHALLEQAPSIWVDGAVPSALESAAASHFDAAGALSPAYAALAEAVQIIDNGAGPLVLSAARARSGIAIVDSRASLLACEVDSQFGGVPEAEAAWVGLLRRTGFDFTYVSPAQIAAGALEPYRAVILPQTRALSVEQAAAIAGFAQQGGALLADLAPGEWSDLGAPQEAPLLDEWFGVRHEGRPTAKSATLEGHALNADGATRAADAQSAVEGDVPLHLRIEQDKRRALLLNHALPASSGPWDALLRDFLLASGCARAVELSGDEKDAAWLSRVRFRYGQAEIVAVLADPAAPEKLEARVGATEAQFAFDLSAGERIERTKKAVVRPRAGEARVLSLLPYEVSAVDVKAQGIVEQGKRLTVACVLRARKSEPGKHLLRVTLSPPGSAPLPEYTQYLEAEKGAGSTFIPILRGQVPGFYQLEVTDLLSGVAARQEVKIVGLGIQ